MRLTLDDGDWTQRSPQDSMGAMSEPLPFALYSPGVYLHGTKADLAVGEMLVPGRESNFEDGRRRSTTELAASGRRSGWP